MPQVTLNITKKKFTSGYWKIAAVKSRFRVVYGGANAGKSFAVAQNEVLTALHSVQKTLVIRKVASTLKDSVFASFKNRLNEFGLKGYYQQRTSPFDILLPNGSQFLFRGLDDPEKMKSIEGITRLVIEEASELEFDDFKELNRRIRGGKNPQITLMFNPIDEKHWLKTHFFDKNIPNSEIVRLTYKDNEFATKEDIDELEAMKEYDENQYNIYVLAEWGKLKTGSEWYPHFSRIKQVTHVPYIPTLLHTNTTWDFNVVPYITCLCCQIVFVNKYIDAQGVKYDEPVMGSKAIEVLQFRVYKEYTLAIPVNDVDNVGERFEAHHPEDITMDYYGDDQGFNRIEGLGTVTRFSLIDNSPYFARFLHNSSRKARKPNVHPTRRRELVDGIFYGKYPGIEILIDESCTELIDDCENCKQGVKGKLKKRVKNKATGETYEEHGHCSDGLEYLVSEVCKQYID